MAFIAASYYMLDQTIGADIMDYDELNTGKRREGAFSACGSWMNKAGNALGYFLSGQVLGLTGFSADKVTQSPENDLPGSAPCSPAFLDHRGSASPLGLCGAFR